MSKPQVDQRVPSIGTRLVRRLPWPLQRLIAQFQQRLADKNYDRMTIEEIFTRIYLHRIWSPNQSDEFYSGVGSHCREIVGAYSSAVENFLLSLPGKPDVVDLGCGDFNVGASLRKNCGRYVACDVVKSLIDRNRAVFAHLGVDFRHLDMTTDALPLGEVAFIRQVLQHLNNEQITRVVNKLHAFKFVVVTEHLPMSEDFQPNIDKPSGHGIRAGRLPPSGVVLTAPPFHLEPLASTVLVEVSSEGGRIQTIAYRMH